ncbi:PREDICTED: methylosome protein 50 isoform X2 [Vollenhovia emeryi]|nr:PREDICTED: methylosome protein 50 isoform X2 [Vollenhovia emeryi]
METWTTTPNSSGDVFRNMSFIENRTPAYTKQLQFLEIYDENNALLGGTNMVDLYWNGTLWHYKDLSDFSQERAAVTQRVSSGVTDAVYLGKSRFVSAEDSGAVQVHEIVETDEEAKFQPLSYACQHEDSILTMSVFSNRRNIVTGGMDCCLKIWDTEDLIASYSYNLAHLDIVTSTDVKPMCSSTFVSASLDGESLLWDIRRAKPASCIFKDNNNTPLSAVAWNATLDHLIAIGTANGSVVLIDVRQAGTPLHESVESDRGVHKLSFNPNPERKEQLACCFDSEVVKVIDTYREMLLIHEDAVHQDFVRGLAWCEDDLYSCCWDGRVMKRIVNIVN